MLAVAYAAALQDGRDRFAQAFSASLNANSGGWANFTFRMVYAASLFNLPSFPTRARVRIVGSFAGENCSFAALYIGHGPPSGNAYAFREAETTKQLLNSSGVGSFILSAGASIVLEAPFVWDRTAPVVISGAIDNNLATDEFRFLAAGAAGSQGYFKSGGNDAATVAATGYTSGAANVNYLIDRIEFDGY